MSLLLLFGSAARLVSGNQHTHANTHSELFGVLNVETYLTRALRLCPAAWPGEEMSLSPAPRCPPAESRLEAPCRPKQRWRQLQVWCMSHPVSDSTLLIRVQLPNEQSQIYIQKTTMRKEEHKHRKEGRTAVLFQTGIIVKSKPRLFSGWYEVSC